MTTEVYQRDLGSVLRRRSRLIAGIAVLGTTLIFVGGLLIPAHYTAKAQLVVDPQQVGVMAHQAAVIEQSPDEPAVLTEMTALSSHDHLQRVLDSLARDREFRAVIAGAPAASDKQNEGDWWRTVRTWFAQPWLALTGEAGVPNMRQLERHLKVYQEAGSHVIAVSYTSTSPEAAALIANRMVQLYVQSQTDQMRASTDHSLAWLGQRIPQLDNVVHRLESALQDYQVSHNLADTTRTGVTDQQLGDLSRQLAAAEADFAARKARLGEIRKLRERGSDPDTLAATLGSPTLIELRRQEMALLQSHADYSVGFAEANPRMQQVRSQLQEVRRQIGRELDRGISNLDSEAQVAAAQVQSVQKRLTAVQSASTDAHLREMEHEAGVQRHLYEGLLQRKEELQEQRETLAPTVHVLSLAAAPEHPSSFNPVLFVFPGLIVSTIAGCMLAVLLERLDSTLRSERDITDALGIPCIGFVPQLRRIGRTRPHQHLLDKPFSAYSEAIRSVQAALQMAAPAQEGAPKVILISSSVPGEGKTTLAVSFATYTARLGRRVLLVDLDFRHPAILRELGGVASQGVLDLLLHNRPSAEVIQRIPSLQLDYLPVRRGRVDPLTLLSGEHLSRLIQELRGRYDCVVIDSAPLLAVAEARLLASLVDKVLFVVQWASTPRIVAQNALSLLQRPGMVDADRPNLASAVITQVDLKKYARYGYGDGAGSFIKYSHYYGQQAQN